MTFRHKWIHAFSWPLFIWLGVFKNHFIPLLYGKRQRKLSKRTLHFRMLVKYHHLVYLRSWSEFHRLLIPWFPACFRLVKSCHKPFDLLFKEVRHLSSAYFTCRRIHFHKHRNKRIWKQVIGVYWTGSFYLQISCWKPERDRHYKQEVTTQYQYFNWCPVHFRPGWRAVSSG